MTYNVFGGTLNIAQPNSTLEGYGGYLVINARLNW